MSGRPCHCHSSKKIPFFFFVVLSHFPPSAANVLRGFSPPQRTFMPQSLTDNNKTCPVPKIDFELLAIGRHLGPSGVVDKGHKVIFRPTSDKGCIITPSDLIGGEVMDGKNVWVGD
jgi:hypothetical protein